MPSIQASPLSGTIRTRGHSQATAPSSLAPKPFGSMETEAAAAGTIQNGDNHYLSSAERLSNSLEDNQLSPSYSFHSPLGGSQRQELRPNDRSVQRLRSQSFSSPASGKPQMVPSSHQDEVRAVSCMGRGGGHAGHCFRSPDKGDTSMGLGGSYGDLRDAEMLMYLDSTNLTTFPLEVQASLSSAGVLAPAMTESRLSVDGDDLSGLVATEGPTMVGEEEEEEEQEERASLPAGMPSFKWLRSPRQVSLTMRQRQLQQFLFKSEGDIITMDTHGEIEWSRLVDGSGPGKKTGPRRPAYRAQQGQVRYCRLAEHTQFPDHSLTPPLRPFADAALLHVSPIYS